MLNVRLPLAEAADRRTREQLAMRAQQRFSVACLILRAVPLSPAESRNDLLNFNLHQDFAWTI